jgi:hypothetical protein
VSSLVWSHDDPISKATDDLLAKYNPASAANRRAGRPSPLPDWIVPPFSVKSFHTWIEGLPFSRESWRGRIRASKWIGAALPAEKVAAFDREHDVECHVHFPWLAALGRLVGVASLVVSWPIHDGASATIFPSSAGDGAPRTNP